jgi:nucleotide-binding universal stress UspA family protein
VIERILVPLDGSDLSAEVVWQVRRLLLGFEAEVELYTVVVPILESWRERQEDRPDRESRHLDLRVEDARRHLKKAGKHLAEAATRVVHEVEIGDAADMILRRAARTHPSLIAMATHGRSGPSRWVRGSVAQRVLRESPAPILMVNPAWRDEVQGIHFRRILVPIDGSERSASILPLVVEFAKVFEAEVILQRVWVPPTPDSAEAEREMASRLEPTRAELEEAGLVVRVRAGAGRPAAEILDAAEEEDVDLVAMSTHGSSGPARWFYGSVTEKVLRRCSRPLLVKRTVALPVELETQVRPSS